MTILVGITIFILGLIVGSFVNVWVIRTGNGIGRYERSRCLSCTYQLGFFDLIPVASFLFLGGRCRKCKSKISRQYVFVELAMGVLFLLVFFRGGIIPPIFEIDMVYIIETVLMMIVSALLVAMTTYDIRHKIVPLQMSTPFVVLGLTFMGLEYFMGGANITNLFAGVLLFVPFLLLWYFSRGAWMGLGDIVLMFGIGTMLGFIGGISALLITFWGATIFLLVVMLPPLFFFDIRLFNVQKGTIMKAEIPLVPFLSLGTFLVLVYDIDIISLFIW